MSPPRLVEHFFRREYGRLVATFSRRVGVQHIEAIEDAAQAALMAALESWTRTGVPDNPTAWLYRATHNALLDELRRRARREGLIERYGSPDDAVHEPDTAFSSELQDDLLRMLFVCCDDAIAVESQLVVALRTLCGFDVREIAHRLFLSEANVYKRLTRARERLRELPLQTELSLVQYASRLPAVHAVLYLLFTEGYLSSHPQQAIRSELCEEAIRLATLLAEHSIGASPQTFALLALMHLHTARSSARADASGGLLLLEEQDRAQWDARQIQRGLEWLARSADGEAFSRYHAEAGIAAEHCLAPSFAQTRWDRIVASYELLERVGPSAIHTLNRALAIAEWKGPAAGLAVLEAIEPPTWLSGSYLWSAVLADLHRRCAHTADAERYRELAIEAAPSEPVRALLARRLRG